MRRYWRCQLRVQYQSSQRTKNLRPLLAKQTFRFCSSDLRIKLSQQKSRYFFQGDTLKIRDLDGNVHKWRVEGNSVRANESRPRSKLHMSARSLLKTTYPTLQICEEVPAQIRRDRTAFIDFYINTIKTVIEVHGAQHYKFNSLYHTCAQDFLNQKKRDADLRDWCALNNLSYIELPFNENEEQWVSRIQQQNS